MTGTTNQEKVDVVVVGAGPAGAAAAYYLAQTGLEVLLVDKASFPRDKICGDGLTPRAVKELLAMGIDLKTPGWVRTKGARVTGGRLRVEIDWPDLASYPGFGLVRTREDFDHILVRRAQTAGARMMEGTKVTDTLFDDRTGHVRGVRAQRDGATYTYAADLVVAADGASSRIAVALGLQQRKDRPMGVGLRRYYTTRRQSDDYIETWLDLHDPAARGRRQLLPGYGWIFPAGAGRWNVGIGLISLNRRFNFDHRHLMTDWTHRLPKQWQIDEDHAEGPIRGHALPMGFNRLPQYTRGALLTGDAAGMINPLSGEGIDYALESGRLSAEVIVQALGRPTAAQRERALHQYRQVLKDSFGSYFTLCTHIIRAMENPHIMKFIASHG
ncbi:MAG TPA: geranylgeranyl reductase family protein, partial [Streptomyces sp.]|nr:geranylgeranyl reductase family protein [Streptomyces sp.]